MEQAQGLIDKNAVGQVLGSFLSLGVLGATQIMTTPNNPLNMVSSIAAPALTASALMGIKNATSQKPSESLTYG